MKNTHYSYIVMGVLATVLTGCANITPHHAEAPLPVGSSEQRGAAYARDARVWNPSLTKTEAASQAAAATAGQETKAEADWRQNQKAGAEQERFEKDLDALTKTK